MDTKPKSLFIVSASYMAECCTRPHIWVEIIKAKDKRAARSSLRKKLLRREYDVGDIAVIILPSKVKTTDFDFLSENSR